MTRLEALEEAAKVAEKRVRCQSNYDMCREAEIICGMIRALMAEEQDG